MLVAALDRISGSILILGLAVTGCSACYEHDPLVVVVLMVKNEAHVIKQTLQPYVHAGIDSYLIFDTGSDDNTCHIAQEFFDDNNISYAVIQQESFIDFATSRNRALVVAQQHFPNAHFFLMPDAEWYLVNTEGLITFCQEQVLQEEASYLLRITNDLCDFYTARLIRSPVAVQFTGRVHEVPMPAATQRVPDNVYFDWSVTEYGYEKSHKRWERDCRWLLEDHAANPNATRTLFLLGQTYAALGDKENALMWYKKRADIKNCCQELFLTYYRIGFLYDASRNWDEALCWYMKAAALAPHRAEPLVQLAQHYWDTDDYELCFLFARRAVELPYPSDVLFIEKELYDYTRYDLLGRSAWYVGIYELGEDALRKASTARPDMPHIQYNLMLYENRKIHMSTA